MYEQQKQLGEDRQRVRKEQPGLITEMTKGASPRIDQMRDTMASHM